jgi:NAD(P)-dependent dehydrogenase (short-subunit alcohol dehydrogenase family)
MGKRLLDKVAVVTGGAGGIGRATAALFAEEGARLVIADFDEPGSLQVVSQIKEEGGEATFILTDVSREEDARHVCDKALEMFGKLDILVNNAAAFVLKGLDATVPEWERSLSVNVIGTSLMSRSAAEAMKQGGAGGAIVNLGSVSGFIAQSSFLTYSAAKAAIIQMTRNMAMDLAPQNIRVNCVCPGTILTRASYDYMECSEMSFEEFVKTESAKHLMGRLGQPREVAAAILFLASDEASFITGTSLVVDGGYMVR